MSALMHDIETLTAPFGAQRDLITIIRRVENEGLSFLTITLPKFFDDLISAIEEGKIDSSMFRAFSKYRSKPKLFSGLTSRIFDDTGCCYETVDPQIIRALRQICYAFKKVKLECTEQRIAKSYEQFVSTDISLTNSVYDKDLIFCANFIVSTIFPELIKPEFILPKPGPGAIFEKTTNNSKFRVREVAASLKEYFGEACIYTSEEYYNASTRKDSHFGIARFQDESLHRERDQELTYPCTRIVSVPKTLKSPRLIAIEPCWTMMYQQGVKDLMYSLIENSSLSAGQINFVDQQINQRLAKESSITKGFATIDMSEASDRISLDNVLNFFSSNRSLLDALMATRTGEAMLPDGRKFELNKFSSMGSATCFPVESLCFFIAGIYGQHLADGVTPCPFSIRKYAKNTFVYGDDIIVPSYTYNHVKDLFTSLGWKVNSTKTFVKSHFRESCGLDAFNGTIVTPVYVRSPLNKDMVSSPSGYVSTIETINQFYGNDYQMTAEFLAAYLDNNVPSAFRVKSRYGSVGLGVDIPSYPKPKLRFNKTLFRLEQRIISSEPVYRNDHLEGHAALFKCLIKPHDSKFLESEDPKHLERTVLRYGNKLKHRWSAVQ